MAQIAQFEKRQIKNPAKLLQDHGGLTHSFGPTFTKKPWTLDDYKGYASLDYHLHGAARWHVRGSIVASISACHAADPGSIPGRRVLPLEACGWSQCFRCGSVESMNL